MIRDLRVKFSIRNLPQSPDIWQNSDGGISDFRITGRSLMKENCYNSRTSDDIDLKLGPVTKLDKINKTTCKKFTMISCRENLMSLSLPLFMANLEKSGNRIPGAESVKLTFSLEVTFYLTKTANRIQKSLTELSHYCFKATIFVKNADFFQKMLTSAKLKVSYIFWKYIYVILRTKFQVSSIILTSFRQSG